MDRKLVWTEKASSDIEATVRYIARRDPKAAARIGLGIYDRAQILLEHPEAGTILDELRQGGWRKLIFRRWKIRSRVTHRYNCEFALYVADPHQLRSADYILRSGLRYETSACRGPIESLCHKSIEDLLLVPSECIGMWPKTGILR